MAYTTCNTVNRLVGKQLHLNYVVSERSKGGINLYIKLEKHKLDQIHVRNITMYNVSRQRYSFTEVKLLCPRRKTYEKKYDICDKNLHTVLAIACSCVKQPNLASQYMMQVSNMFMVNFIQCILSLESKFLETYYLALEVSLNNAQCINT